MKKRSSRNDFNENGHVIILLHGFLATSKYWSKLQPHLSRAGYRVIAIDLLGFGKAPKPSNQNYSYDDHIEYLNKTIERLNLDKPFTLVGHSMGALLAARFCRVYPNYVSANILLHPPLYKDSDEAQTTLRRTGRLYRFLLDSQFRHLGWMLLKVVTHRYIGQHGQVAREKSLVNVIEKAEAFTDLQTSVTDTLLIVGSRDRPEYISNLTKHPLGKHVRVSILDVDHHSPVREAKLIEQKILDFLSTH